MLLIPIRLRHPHKVYTRALFLAHIIVGAYLIACYSLIGCCIGLEYPCLLTSHADFAPFTSATGEQQIMRAKPSCRDGIATWFVVHLSLAYILCLLPSPFPFILESAIYHPR